MKTILMLGAALALAACGSSAVPPAKITEARSAISAASAVGAEGQPNAALHLKLARDQVAQAEQLIKNGDNAEASLVLERAQKDAELALVLTREAKVRAEAQQALEQVQQLGQPQ